MASVETSITIDAPAEDVWETVRAFGNIDRYTPPVEHAESDGDGVGMTRVLTLQDGAQVTERLEALDEEKRTLSYVIVDAPLPIQDYVSTMTVRATDGGRCEVTWACSFAPDGVSAEAVKPDLEALYTAGLEGLRTLHGSHHAEEG